MQASAINYQPMTTIRLHGQLRQFGKSFRIAVKSPAEAVKALCVQLPGFERFLSNAKSRGMEFAVFRGKKNISNGELGYQGRGDIKIVPVIVGSKRAGILQTIVGAALLVASIWFPALAPAGIAMVAGGVIQMLSPQAGGLKTSAAPENTPGYAFGSAKNTTASGNPVSLCYGRRRWGGAIISAAIYAEDQM
ncbi:tail assembly protein [Pseudomonas lundensis]|uniref:tail assembly protein n=1 Tax=Pseudomonas lundensis TaxID=86185 RepID=UPI00147527FE|nr:tail assembly protein [Pseudomonas lundensis]NMZ56436.1 tail assembly protein [Pseudomonas lundensis]